MRIIRIWSSFRRRVFRLRPRQVVGGPFRYPEAKFGKGELTYVRGFPVLRLGGSPEEMGRQAALLGVLAAPRILHYPHDLLAFFLGSRLLSKVVMSRLIRIGRGMAARFPESYHRELRGLIDAGLPPKLMIAANTMFDMKNMPVTGLFGCSSLLVEPLRSSTGGTLLGRNMDFFPLGYLQDYALVVVYPEAKDRPHGFVSVGYPGMLGCFSGMNDVGLSIASHEVFAPRTRRKFNWHGLTFGLSYRRVLEECTTVSEAFNLLNRIERTTSTSVAVADRNGGAVFEVTPDCVVARECREGFAVCTNHFVAEPFANPRQRNTYRTLDRIATLRQSIRERPCFSIDDVRSRMDAVSQGPLTLQTMVFEPAALRLHLSMGPPPSSAKPLIPLELRELFVSPA